MELMIGTCTYLSIRKSLFDLTRSTAFRLRRKAAYFTPVTVCDIMWGFLFSRNPRYMSAMNSLYHGSLGRERADLVL